MTDRESFVRKGSLAAIRQECPDAAPDFTSFHRRAVLDEQMQIWE